LTEELGEGLYLATVGMGLVFLTLVAFMLILFALGKLFPGEEVAEDSETDEAAAGADATEQAGHVSVQPVFVAAQQPARISVGSGDGRIPGAKIAAMAVAMYLATEQGESVVNTTAPAATMNQFRGSSVWAIHGRESLRESQGHRPQSYGHKSHSAYSPRDGLR
jgi:Na+-transporting methylmalonyl-CoA/oxaloacetate decarboxylase gamma subunit